MPEETIILEPSDHELVKTCLSGQDDAFSTLVGRYERLVWSVIYNFTGDHPDSNDLSQEVFLRVYRSLHRYNPEYKFSTWVMRIAANLCINWLHKKKSDPVSVDEIAGVKDNRSNPEEQYLEKERMNRIQEAVAMLPIKYRAPIVLFHRQGLSYKDIAEVLNLPETIVKNRLHRARLMLRDRLTSAMEDIRT
jgi:RNA polymerase sigma-70 factor (ECF subfamily)